LLLWPMMQAQAVTSRASFSTIAQLAAMQHRAGPKSGTKADWKESANALAVMGAAAGGAGATALLVKLLLKAAQSTRSSEKWT
jgi:hypothetical protein